MKQLKDLLVGIADVQIEGDPDLWVDDIHIDSRTAGQNDLFAAIPGSRLDGHSFIDVVKAKVVVCERLPEKTREGITYVCVKDSRLAWAKIANAYYDFPSSRLRMVGVTGTNGKTSIATLLYRLLGKLGEKSGLVSTIDYRIGEETRTSTHTTPDSKALQGLFADMVAAGCGACCMEVSSHALSQDRVEGISFDAAIFTNITHDHLDYHGTFAAYLAAKKRLFDQLPASAVALVNADDKNAKIMVQNCAAKVKTYAAKQLADYHVKVLENTLYGLRLLVDRQDVWFRLLGSFNAYNLAAVYGVARELGYEQYEVLQALSEVEGVSGRIQVVRVKKGPVGIVDYAHTPDALQNVLNTLKDITRGEVNIITVVGCGGDRDRAKRPIMGKIATQMSDKVIFTSDNPRSEEAEAIIEEMVEGVSVAERKKPLRIVDRKAAIQTACMLAAPEDVILVAGKGHETYQEIKGVKYPFDDVQILTEYLNLLNPT